MPKRVSPLLALANKLLSRGIPSLTTLIAQISEAEDYAQFIDMVKTYLPERKRDILQETTPQAQIARFASYFEDRYFPLEEIFKLGDLEGYGEITYRIPAIVLGFSYDDYHDLEWRAGALLMNYLIESPWEEGEGIYVALAEACSDHVPEALIKRADAVRLPLEEAQSLLKSTRYEPLALWAAMVYQDTGNFFLDTDYEMLMNSIGPEWSPENVKELTKLWKQAELIQDKTGEFMEWLEKDLPGHFEELVSFIEGRKNDEKKTPR